MSKKDQIRSALIKLLKSNTTIQTFAAEVKSVDETKYTCDVDPVDGAPTHFDVRLKASIDDSADGIIVIPEVGSLVLVSTIGNDDHYKYVSVYGAVKRYLIKNDKGSFEINDDGLKLNGDEFGGITKTKELKTQLDKNNAILNAILNIINGAPIAEAGGGAASGLQTALKFVLSGKTIGSFANIENKKVQHG